MRVVKPRDHKSRVSVLGLKILFKHPHSVRKDGKNKQTIAEGPNSISVSALY